MATAQSLGKCADHRECSCGRVLIKGTQTCSEIQFLKVALKEYIRINRRHNAFECLTVGLIKAPTTPWTGTPDLELRGLEAWVMQS